MESGDKVTRNREPCKSTKIHLDGTYRLSFTFKFEGHFNTW